MAAQLKSDALLRAMKRCLDEILTSGIHDWVQAAEVAAIAREVGKAQPGAATRELSLRLIRGLLETGLAEVGMVSEEKGFVAWDTSVEESMRRITHEWLARPNGPGPGEVCWLNLTAEGERRAKSLLVR